MPNAKITLRQADVIVAIRNLQHLHGYIPSHVELSQALGIARGSVQQHLDALEKKGLIRRHAKKARALEILPAA